MEWKIQTKGEFLCVKLGHYDSSITIFLGKHASVEHIAAKVAHGTYDSEEKAQQVVEYLNKEYRIYSTYDKTSSGELNRDFWTVYEYHLKNIIPNYSIKTTEKGTKLLVPATGKIVVIDVIPCGYRGSSKIKIIEPENAQKYTFYRYESPKGNLGISQGFLIVIARNERVVVEWHRDGRLYGGPSKGVMIFEFEKGGWMHYDGITYEELTELIDVNK